MATLQRLRWLFTERPIYFITACSYNRRRILDQPAVHDSLIQFGLRACEYRVWVGHYIIMPDQIHLFVGFGPESMTVSAWVKSLKNAISKTFRNASFQGGNMPAKYVTCHSEELARSQTARLQLPATGDAREHRVVTQKTQLAVN